MNMLDGIRKTFKEESSYKLFLMSVLMAGLAYGLYKGVIDNYLAEVIQMGEIEKGINEFFRELPGVLLVFILAIFYNSTAENLYKLGCLIGLVGMAMHALVPKSFVLITICMLIFSTGDHIQLGMKSTITLEYSNEKRGGEALGYMNALHSVGMVAGYIVVAVVFAIFAGKAQPFIPFFWIATAIFAVVFVLSCKMKGTAKTDESKRRFYFNKKFTKYYMLEVFYGARKQVFFTFGPFVLILLYGASTAHIGLLYAISSIVCFIASPWVGKIIDKLGYKIVMISDTLILVIVCFFYGFAHHIFPKNVAYIICCINYILDSVISLASMASNVYVQDIADSESEVKATISTGVSVNHLISIFIALFGGVIWNKLGVETLFIVSAVLGLCNSAYAASIKGTVRPAWESWKKK